MADVAGALDDVLSEPSPACGPSRLRGRIRGTGELRQISIEHVDVGFLQMRERRHPLSAFLNALVEGRPRSSCLLTSRRASGRFSLLLQVLSHQLERRPLHEPKNGLDLRGRPRALGPMAGLTVEPVQIGAAQYDRTSNRQQRRARL